MKFFLISVVASAVLGIAVTPIYANDAHHSKAEAQKCYTVKGEVVTVDKTVGKVLQRPPAPSSLNSFS